MAVASSFTYGFSYDVFLSFRGSDTRYGFTGFLHRALEDKGIHTFFDEVDLEGGDGITTSLVKAIQESRIAIPVFSENYASSSFCLDELVNIINYFKEKGRLVLPVFYKVDPSQVRYQTGSYGEALAKHKARFMKNMRLQNWKTALNQAANLSGYHYKHGDGYEHKFIEKIVENVTKKINRVLLPVADYPVGLESQVLNVNSLLDVGSDGVVHMLGIHGIGGVGKTTLALAVYNSIADHFEALCFLENVRENSSKHGLQHLQSILLSQTLGDDKIELASVRQGISIIQHRLQQKKVLLIVDDVNNEEQLQAIVGKPNWFGLGSRIIITTREKHLLARHNIKKLYEVNELNKEDAFQLLNWKAFKSEHVDPCYKDVLYRVVMYASGLPLALEVIGSSLFGKSTEEWESALNRFERIPNEEIQDILKVSFDSLKEDEQSVFLDIACCFKGYGLPEIEDILRAHYDDNMKYHIGSLVEKSLIKLDHYGKVTMHDLMEDMGKEIVRKESPKESGKRSRLWFSKDIIRVLEENSGTGEIEIICLQLSKFNKEEIVEWNGKAFKKMKNLRTLIIKNVSFSEGPKHLPNSLRVLEWWQYPSQNLPYDFHPRKLVICNLPGSCFSSLELSAGLFSKKKLVNLISLNFDHCEYLTGIPDVSCLQQLQKLSFSWCENVSNIHDSVGFLNKLKILDASLCYKLRRFPPIMLTSLEKFDLTGCKLKKFPEVLGKMENLRKLSLTGTPIRKIPPSFRNLTGLQELYLNYGKTSKIDISIQNIVTMPELVFFSAYGLDGWLLPKEDEGEGKVNSSNIQRLRLVNCNLSDEFFPIVPKLFANVQELHLRNNNFIVIPECAKEFRVLKKLDLSDCLHLQKIRGIPPNMKEFRAEECESLTSSTISKLLNQELHEAGNTYFILPGATIPEWFDHLSMRTSISFWFREKIPALLLCFVLSERADSFIIINGHKSRFDIHRIEMDHTILFDLRNTTHGSDLSDVFLENEWNHAEILYEDKMGNPIFIQSGIHLLEKESSMDDIRLINPCMKRKLDDGLTNPCRKKKIIKW